MNQTKDREEQLSAITKWQERADQKHAPPTTHPAAHTKRARIQDECASWRTRLRHSIRTIQHHNTNNTCGEQQKQEPTIMWPESLQKIYKEKSNLLKHTNKLCEIIHDLPIKTVLCAPAWTTSKITTKQHKSKTRKQPIQTTDPDANEKECLPSLVRDCPEQKVTINGFKHHQLSFSLSNQNLYFSRSLHPW